MGAPRIHGELLKLGVDIGQTSVAKYMVRRRDPLSQGWRTFLLTLQLPFMQVSESMGNHDSKIVDAASVD